MNTDDPEDVIYKICPQRDWQQACDAGIYEGSLDDKRDGFIHFSTRTQVPGTLAKHFSGQDDLILLAVGVSFLTPGLLRYEKSRNGELFPHLYGNLVPSAVKERYIIRLRTTGEHEVDF